MSESGRPGPWDLGRRGHAPSTTQQKPVMSSEEWPSLAPIIIADRVSSLRRDSKKDAESSGSPRGWATPTAISHSSESIDSGTEELSDGKLCESSAEDTNWPVISGDELGPGSSGLESLPLPGRRSSGAKSTHLSGSESTNGVTSLADINQNGGSSLSNGRDNGNGGSISSGNENGGSSVASDDVAENQTPLVVQTTVQKKKSSKLKWKTLELPTPLSSLKYHNSRRGRDREQREREPRERDARERQPARRPFKTDRERERERRQDSPSKINGNWKAHYSNMQLEHYYGKPPDPRREKTYRPWVRPGPKTIQNKDDPGGSRGGRSGHRAVPAYQYVPKDESDGVFYEIPVQKPHAHEPNFPAQSDFYSFFDFMCEYNSFSPREGSPQFIQPNSYNSLYTTIVSEDLMLQLLRHQIEYYFCSDNLAKDFYIRRKMDSEGYLPVELISSFKRVQNLTLDVDLVIKAIRTSKHLEVRNRCVRTIYGPRSWPIPDVAPKPLEYDERVYIPPDPLSDDKHMDELESLKRRGVNVAELPSEILAEMWMSRLSNPERYLDVIFGPERDPEPEPGADLDSSDPDTDYEVPDLGTVQYSYLETQAAGAERETSDLETELKTLHLESDLEIPQVVAELETSQVVAELETPKIVAELETPQVEADLETSNIVAELDTPQVVAELETPQVEADLETSNIVAELDTPQVVAELETPQVEADLETSQVVAELETSQVEVDLETSQVVAELETLQVEVDLETSKIVAELETPQVEADLETSQVVTELETHQVVAELETTQVVAELETPEVVLELETPQVVPELETPQVVAELETPQVVAELETPEVVLELETPQVVAELETPEVVAELETPQVEACLEIPQLEAHLKTPQVEACLEIPQVEAHLETPQVEAGIALNTKGELTDEWDLTTETNLKSSPDLTSSTELEAGTEVALEFKAQ